MIESSEDLIWQISDTELLNQNIRAFIVKTPNNPSSVKLSDETLKISIRDRYHHLMENIKNTLLITEGYPNDVFYYVEIYIVLIAQESAIIVMLGADLMHLNGPFVYLSPI